MNGGDCVNVASTAGAAGSYECKCHNAFSGDNCEYANNNDHLGDCRDLRYTVFRVLDVCKCNATLGPASTLQYCGLSELVCNASPDCIAAFKALLPCAEKNPDLYRMIKRGADAFFATQGRDCAALSASSSVSLSVASLVLGAAAMVVNWL
jgi:hypothetical protein